jgi:3-oxoadipate enol-lactonase
MAFVERSGARIYWHALGKGEPLVLIMGLGCSSSMWFRLTPRLAKRNRVIMLDNRGVGRTEAPYFLVHQVTTMARDVVAVLEAAGESSAHIMGLSMGGMIAQQLAIDHPQTVRSMILAATNCGGSRAILAEEKVWRLLFSKGELAPEEALRAMQPYTYAANTPRSLIEEDILVRLANYPTLRGYQAQLYGLMGWTSYTGLSEVRARTLVLHGEEDQLIPPQNGRLLADRIPDAKLIEIENASHWLHTDQLDRIVAAVQAFIAPGQNTAR